MHELEAKARMMWVLAKQLVGETRLGLHLRRQGSERLAKPLGGMGFQRLSGSRGRVLPARCSSSIAPGARAPSIPTASEIPYHQAVSRGVRCLAAAGAGPSASRLPAVSPRRTSSEPSLQARACLTPDLFRACGVSISCAGGAGRRRRHLVLD